MNREVTVLIAEDDEGHAALIRKNLARVGITNPIMHFRDGDAVLNFLFRRGAPPHRESCAAYLLLLDIRMPKVDGVEVLRQVKADPELRKLPVIMVTTTDDPGEVARCHEIGCNNYITKPVDYEKFITAIRQLGLYLMVIEVPEVNSNGIDKGQ